MTMRAFGWCLVGVGLWACGAGGDAPPAAPEASEPGSNEAAPPEADVASVARYRFVDTEEGMTVEAVSETQVLTFSCPQRSCGSMCSDCALQACRQSGELEAVCDGLLERCVDTCDCNGAPSCGFPVCAFDRMICYVDEQTTLPGAAPSDPTDPGFFGPAGRPSEASSIDGPPGL